MVRVAKKPTMMFCVANTKMGKATQIPIAIPNIAEEESVCKEKIGKIIKTFQINLILDNKVQFCFVRSFIH